MREIFVTGTDTNVGKTIVSAALMHRHRSALPVRYWKPVQTGVEIDNDTARVKELGMCNGSEILDAGIRLPHPVSPDLAARLAGQTISIDEVVSLIAGDFYWIVEGAGGVMVPLNTNEMMVDLMARLNLPVVIAARSELGTINHTLLSLTVLRQRSVRIAFVVMVGDSNLENRRAIETYGNTSVYEMPWFRPLSSAALQEWAKSSFPELQE